MAATVITIVLMIFSAALSTGLSAWQVAGQVLNDQTRSKIGTLIKQVNDLIINKSADSDRILSALQTKNSLALQDILLSNPVTGRSVSHIVKDSVLINDLTTRQNKIKNDLNQLLNETNTLNSSSISGNLRDQEKIKDIEGRIQTKTKELDAVNEEIGKFKPTGTGGRTIISGPLNPISQNVQGGMKNA